MPAPVAPQGLGEYSVKLGTEHGATKLMGLRSTLVGGLVMESFDPTVPLTKSIVVTPVCSYKLGNKWVSILFCFAVLEPENSVYKTLIFL